MKREKDFSTRRIVFDVRPAGGAVAAVKLVLGGRPYLWLGHPIDDRCIGTIEGRELRNLARAILREIDPHKPAARSAPKKSKSKPRPSQEGSGKP